jgi:hypothetical protein
MVFLGELGPVGICLSCCGNRTGAGGVPEGGLKLSDPPGDDGDEENLEEMLDNHDPRRPVGPAGEADFGMFNVKLAVFSDELLLPDLCGIGLGAVGACSTGLLPLPLPLCSGLIDFAAGTVCETGLRSVKS